MHLYMTCIFLYIFDVLTQIACMCLHRVSLDVHKHTTYKVGIEICLQRKRLTLYFWCMHLNHAPACLLLMYRKQVSLIFLKWLLSCFLCRRMGREFSCSLLELTLALITSTKQELNFVFKGNYPSLHVWCVCKGLCTSILEVHQHKHF